MESDRMFPRYVYHKPFTVRFHDRCEWQNGLKPDIVCIKKYLMVFEMK
jgi:hypothetical protein